MILKSRAEYNGGHIPRLQMEEQTKTKMKEEEREKEDLKKNKQLEEEQLQWEQDKTKKRDKERRQLAGEWRSNANRREGGAKRPKEREQAREKGEKKERANRKKMRYALLREVWGTAPPTQEADREQVSRREEGAN